MTQSTADKVLAALTRYELRAKSGGRYLSNSPLRPGSDSHALSLIINGPEHGAYVDFVSGEKGSLYDLAAKLGIHTPKAAPSPERRIVATYDYIDVDGTLIYQACRYEPGRDGRTKDFSQRVPDGNGGWRWSMDGITRVLYHLPEVQAAVTDGATIYIVEGEKDADQLGLYDLVATTNVGGAGKWRSEYSAILAGAIIVVMPDNDGPGLAHAEQVAASLHGVAASVTVVNLPGLPPKGDVSDWLNANHTIEELHAMVAATAAYVGIPEPPQHEAAEQDHRSAPITKDQALVLNELNMTDLGNAEALALLSGANLRFCTTHDAWFVWNGSQWHADDTSTAFRAVMRAAHARRLAAEQIEGYDTRKKAVNWAICSENRGKIESALAVAGKLSAFTTTIERYDADPLLAATGGATLDLRNGTARPPERGDYITMALGTAYDPAARCPRWERFLGEIFDNDKELIRYIQRATGYCLTGDTREQKIFLCYGKGSNGKSRFLEVLTRLLGDYSANASFDTFDADRRSDNTNDLAALKGRRLVTVIETEADRRLAEARVKSVTGGDLITARFLYGEFFSYRPQFKIWMSMNHLPVIKGTERGIWRRLKLIPFLQSFEGREDMQLDATLQAELPGILNWALVGLREWQAHGLGRAVAIDAATQKYQEESDQVGRWLSDCTVAGPRFTTTAAAAYKSYSGWSDTNGEKSFTQSLWGRRLSDLGFTRERGRTAWTWHGFGLIDDRDGAPLGESVIPVIPVIPCDPFFEESPQDYFSNNPPICDPCDPCDPFPDISPMQDPRGENSPKKGSQGITGITGITDQAKIPMIAPSAPRAKQTVNLGRPAVAPAAATVPSLPERIAPITERIAAHEADIAAALASGESSLTRRLRQIAQEAEGSE